MRDPALLGVRERLLRAGIAPRHVNRYIMELRDHLTDLISRERSAGLTAEAAQLKAHAILGTEEQLVQAMIERGTPKSLAAKAPWAVFGLFPLVALFTALILLGASSVAFFAPFSNTPAPAIPEQVRIIGQLVTLLGSYGLGPLLAVACITVALRQRLASPWIWVALALIALVCGPLGIHIYFLQPGFAVPGGFRGSAIQMVLADGVIDLAATLRMMCLRTIVLFTLSALAFRLLKQRLVPELA